MADGIDELTEKEKEALRLLLAGHDAKSSAVELDISVHTLNDRLRNARRKLEVSSSREAARILGDAEGNTPQNPVHEAFGMGQESNPTNNAVLTQTRPTGPSRTVWLTGGMLIMSIAIAVAIFAAVSPTETPTTNAGASPQSAETTARVTPEDAESLNRAQTFLGRVDAMDWQGSWNATGSAIRDEVSVVEWESQVKPVREPLGSVNARRLVTAQRSNSLPGAPEGEYEVLQFQTDFAEKDGMSIETVVMMMGADGWEVSGYFIV